MARPVKIRKLIVPHKEILFIPEGPKRSTADSITLLSEEYEAVKLLDYEHMNQLQASKIMGISRPTLTRIYARARKKIAECLVELKELKVAGGNTMPQDNWIKCFDCESVFNLPEKTNSQEFCPVCNSKKTGELK
jgi:uncharacterized protein